MYKTIVVYLSDSQAMPRTLAVAASLANRMDAHLVGAATSGVVERDYLVAAGAAQGTLLAAEDIAQRRADADRQLHSFERVCRENAVASFETRLLDTTPADALLLQSSYCDLLVAGRPDVSGRRRPTAARLPGALVASAARPVLLVPAEAPP